MKYGEEIPMVKKLRDLADFQVPLDEAWTKLAGLCPSLQMKIYKESINADLHAHMLREIYQVVMQSKKMHASVYASVQLKVPLKAMLRLNKIHHDPETLTMRPAGYEKDPYLHMTAGLHHEILGELIDRRLPRFLHPFCKGDDLSRCPRGPPQPVPSPPGEEKSHRREISRKDKGLP